MFSLFRFFESAGKLAALDDEAALELGDLAPAHIRQHRRIVLLGGALGLVGLGAGIALAFFSMGPGGARREGKAIMLAPALFAAAGVLFGVAAGCLFAPTAFLAGPVGQKWMRLVGTRSVLFARLVCLVLLSLPVSFLTFLAWIAWREWQ